MVRVLAPGSWLVLQTRSFLNLRMGPTALGAVFHDTSLQGQWWWGLWRVVAVAGPLADRVLSLRL